MGKKTRRQGPDMGRPGKSSRDPSRSVDHRQKKKKKKKAKK